jgi:CheY-like chemotaxis protein
LGHNELILIVDDEVLIRQVTQRTLEAFGYQVLTAEDGIEAIACYAQHSTEIRAVLMDMVMPNMDGVTAIKTLRKINPDVNIIVTSGLKTSDKVSAAFEENIYGLLVKPYTAEELLNTLQEALLLT